MIRNIIVRYFHVNNPHRAAATSQLATLRKKTGYTFTNCKKALELHNNDLIQAEKWLHQQAQALGWSKATKLEGRQTTQGLIAVTVNNDNAALVEINCETDFVAKNKTFQEMAEATARACLQYAEKQSCVDGSLTKIILNVDQLKQLPTAEGKSLADEMALLIGKLGENSTFRRAMCMKASQNVHLAGYVHPSGSGNSDVLLGKYGGLIAVKQTAEVKGSVQELAKNLCQHVVGMNPKTVGTASDEPSKNPDDETCLIHQEYLIDSLVTVKDILEENGVEVVDFKRFECGEDLTVGVQPLSQVETCQ